MKKLLTSIGLLSVLSSFGAPAINTDVYDYSWYGKTAHLQGNYCLDWSKWVEWYKVGVPPYGKADRTYQYWHSVACNNGIATSDYYTWHDAALNTPAIRIQSTNGVAYATNNYYGVDYRPKRVTEMSGYISKVVSGDVWNTRITYGNTRMWVNGVTNGLYHFKIHFNGGYWTSWWPGDFQPGDYVSATGASLPFNYVADGVTMDQNVVPFNANGDAFFYWNPYGGATLDITPTVTDATKRQHWWYALTYSDITIIP